MGQTPVAPPPASLAESLYTLALQRARVFSIVVIGVDLLLFYLYDYQNYRDGRWAESSFYYYGVIWRAVTVAGFVLHLAADVFLRRNSQGVTTAQRVLMCWYIAWVIAMGTSQSLLQQLIVPDVSIYALCVMCVATLLHLPHRWSWFVYFASLATLITGIKLLGASDAAWVGLATNATSVVVVALVLERITHAGEVRRYHDAHRIRREAERVETAYGLMARELEEARRVLLALLPRHPPEIPQATVAAVSRPAAQVGGDYYDWVVDEDGSLTLIIGDATGHGARAGAMVTATRAVLTDLMEMHDLARMLQRASATLRRLRLPGLYMALAAVRLRGNRLTLAGAGMPAALIHRATDGVVEAIGLSGAPLGAPFDYPYVTEMVMLKPGDTVVLMSDGMLEQRDRNGTEMGVEAVQHLIEQSADASAEELARALINANVTWAGGEPAHDDVTVVVIRMNSSADRWDRPLAVDAAVLAA